MHNLSFDIPIWNRDTVLGLALGALWFAGLSLGMIAVRFFGDSLGALLAPAAVCSASFPALVVTTLFPLLLSACAVFLFHSPGIFVVVLLRSFCLGLLLGAGATVYGDGGTLFGALFLFSALAFSPVLLWYWWRRLSLDRVWMLRDSLVCLGWGLGIAAVDHWMIAPFLADIFTL